jgi:hypothetical protein
LKKPGVEKLQCTAKDAVVHANSDCNRFQHYTYLMFSPAGSLVACDVAAGFVADNNTPNSNITSDKATCRADHQIPGIG